MVKVTRQDKPRFESGDESHATEHALETEDGWDRVVENVGGNVGALHRRLDQIVALRTEIDKRSLGRVGAARQPTF
uniref:Uncharacterized protein n=1 Tax=Marseillevirus LCMAC103 TaxID=2506604 RepID=A0A481YUJ7_9VIRU|nr:MAG: hypothetical protein LCMAC103_01010 [Marseillevirus LCMAC103]